MPERDLPARMHRVFSGMNWFAEKTKDSICRARALPT
jgi:hypothetical protein